MRIPDFSHLPIGALLDRLATELSQRDELVLQAAPGAGKTTAVPLHLLDAAWLQGRRIVMLEPRRMAARAAAARMAELLGESVGQRVGYSIRLDSKTSAATRIEVVTEGILTRRLQADPALEGVGLVIFDEFHERSLDADLCLALCLQGRELFREGEPLKLLVMSATLDGEAVSGLLGDAPVVTAEGRQYPVETHYLAPLGHREPIAAPVAAAVRRALSEQSGSVLVFLPGQREINAVGRELRGAVPAGVQVLPLHGGLSLERQQEAIAPAPGGRRKVVLATNVAETSLTIEGVAAVVDSGRMREARFDPNTGVTRLVTRRVSRASADQRRGRAGRLGPGHCYRLWSAEQDGHLVAQSVPEILQSDLAPLALQLLAWGVARPEELAWLDPPPAAAWAQALDILQQIGALFRNAGGQPQLTPHGVRLAQVPLHPRFAHMLLVGCDIQASETACLLAAVLSERNPLSDRGADLGKTLAVLMGQEHCPASAGGWYRQIWMQARRYAQVAAEVHKPRKSSLAVQPEDVLGILVASAWPDRIARRRAGPGSAYLLANGRSAALPQEDALSGDAWLAVADLGGHAGGDSDRIFSAAPFNPRNLDSVLSALLSQDDIVDWNDSEERFVAERVQRIGAIELSRSPLREVPPEARRDALLGVVRRRGLSLLPWDEQLQQWRARVELLQRSHPPDEDNPWPDLSDPALLADLEGWLAPWLDGVRRLEDFRQLDLRAILHGMLLWPLPLDLERLAPERFSVPSGSSIRIDYSQNPPVLAVKLQEMFGCETTPAVAGGRVSLVVHLLSPAGRPLQVTQDLAGFWRGSYQEVRREMRGRYPKHPWPEDPLEAVATRHTKRRLESG